MAVVVGEDDEGCSGGTPTHVASTGRPVAALQPAWYQRHARGLLQSLELGPRVVRRRVVDDHDLEGPDVALGLQRGKHARQQTGAVTGRDDDGDDRGRHHCQRTRVRYRRDARAKTPISSRSVTRARGIVAGQCRRRTTGTKRVRKRMYGTTVAAPLSRPALERL